MVRIQDCNHDLGPADHLAEDNCLCEDSIDQLPLTAFNSVLSSRIWAGKTETASIDISSRRL